MAFSLRVKFSDFCQPDPRSTRDICYFQMWLLGVDRGMNVAVSEDLQEKSVLFVESLGFLCISGETVGV